jgi:hypothetical protein
LTRFRSLKYLLIGVGFARGIIIEGDHTMMLQRIGVAACLMAMAYSASACYTWSKVQPEAVQSRARPDAVQAGYMWSKARPKAVKTCYTWSKVTEAPSVGYTRS